MKKVFICSSNRKCISNAYLEAHVSEFFKHNGWEMCKSDEKADVIVIATCGVDQIRENEARDMLERYRSRYGGAKQIVVTGCLPKINEKFFQGNPDMVPVAPRELAKFNDLFSPRIPLEKVGPGRQDGVVWQNAWASYLYGQYCIRISQGCANRCSYCAIKKVFGEVSSLSPEVIVEEVKKAEANEHKNILLLADDCGSYGLDLGIDFPKLFSRLCHETAPTTYFSLYYYEPGRFLKHYPELRQDIGRCSSLSIPLQSASARILKRMGRSYDIRRVLATLAEIKERHPGIRMTGHMIYAFPGESRKEFLEGFTLHHYYDQICFVCYSDRPDTAADRLSGKVSAQEVLYRTMVVLKMARAIPIYQIGYDVGSWTEAFIMELIGNRKIPSDVLLKYQKAFVFLTRQMSGKPDRYDRGPLL